LKPLAGLVLKIFVPHSLSFDLAVTSCPETCASKKRNQSSVRSYVALQMTRNPVAFRIV